MSQPVVLVTRTIPAPALDELRTFAKVDLWEHDYPIPKAELQQRAAAADGLLSMLTDQVDACLFDAAPGLRVVANYAVGFNNIDVAAATARGVLVGNTPGVLTEATADLTVGLLLAVSRHIVSAANWARTGSWRTWEPMGHLGMDLVGKSIGIVGLGRIGQAVARRCHFGWNMRVLYADPRRKSEAEAQVGATHLPLADMLATADIVSLHVTLTPETRGLFNAATFSKMKPTALFLNTARGGLVVEADLLDALETNKIAGAGLDVTDPEPPDIDSPLFCTPRLVVLPHIGSSTWETRVAMGQLAVANLKAGLTGLPLPHAVNVIDS